MNSPTCNDCVRFFVWTFAEDLSRHLWSGTTAVHYSEHLINVCRYYHSQVLRKKKHTTHFSSLRWRRSLAWAQRLDLHLWLHQQLPLMCEKLGQSHTLCTPDSTNPAPSWWRDCSSRHRIWRWLLTRMLWMSDIGLSAADLIQEQCLGRHWLLQHLSDRSKACIKPYSGEKNCWMSCDGG